MKIQNILKRLGCAACVLALLAACQSLDEPDRNVPVISSGIVTSTSVGSRYATIGIKEAVLDNDGREYEYYIKYSEQSTLGDDAVIVEKPELYNENFWFYLNNLKPGTTYHYAVCVKNNSDQYEVQSKIMTFTTTLVMGIASVDSLGWDEKTTARFPADSRYAKEMGALIAQRKNVNADFVYGSSSNVRLTRSFVGDEETWSLPREYEFDGGTQYKVVAYSPYSKNASYKGEEGLYVSISEPSTYPLWGESDVITEDKPQADITMKNMMAKIVFIFRSKASSSRNITSINLFNAGRKLARYGWFNVKTGTFTYPHTDSDIIANQVSGEKEFTLLSGESHTCEFMALPGKFGSQDVILDTYFDGNSTLSAFLEGTEWESGKTYTYEVTVDDVKLSVSRFTDIMEWQDDGTSEEINVGGKEQEVENINGHDAVDLGLPSGTKWATCNLGASKPEESGDMYAWGELTPKRSFSLNNYADKNYSIFPNDISGNIKYDAARKEWGGLWRMPTAKECEELVAKCKRELINTTLVKFIGPNGKSIIIPVWRWQFTIGGGVASQELFWTSTIVSSTQKDRAWGVKHDGTLFERSRCYGMFIRPVFPKVIVEPLY